MPASSNHEFGSTRQYRQRSIKDLSFLFALSDNEDEKTKFRDALERFPDELPYDIKSK